MAVNLDAIRKKMQQLSGTPKFWKPEPGEYRIRVLPWNPSDTLAEGEMFPTLFFYNLGEGRDWVQICAPKQFGKADPIDEVLVDLWKGDDDDKAIAKKLRASGQTYVAFIDRGKPERGVQVWKLPGGRDGQALHQQLLGYFLDAEILEDVDDWTDPKKGFDLKITVTETGKVFNGKKMIGFAVETAKKPSPLSADAEQMKKWLDSRPSVKDYYTLEGYDAIKAKLEKWLSSGPTAVPAASDTSGGTSRGSAGPDALDDIANELKKPAEKAPAEDTPARRALDDALSDLEKDD